MVTRIVNFFGHAAVASAVDAVPAAVLGAMLPDFASMCRARLAEPADADVARGIAHHHAADAVFHALPAALVLMRELDERLARAGCARGPRRATSHVGTELLLDGALVGERAYRDAYTSALASEPSIAAVRWRDDDGPPRFTLLVARLRAHGAPDDLRDPAAITARLHRMLAHRPLLAPNAGDLVAIERALAEQQAKVVAAAGAIVRAVIERTAHC